MPLQQIEAGLERVGSGDVRYRRLPLHDGRRLLPGVGAVHAAIGQTEDRPALLLHRDELVIVRQQLPAAHVLPDLGVKSPRAPPAAAGSSSATSSRRAQSGSAGTGARVNDSGERLAAPSSQVRHCFSKKPVILLRSFACHVIRVFTLCCTIANRPWLLRSGS